MQPDGLREKNPLWLRAAYFVSGVVLLFWLSVEDQTLRTPLFLAAGVIGLIGLHFWVRIRHAPCKNYCRRYPLAGGLLAAAIPSLAVLMTIFKSGLHAHGFLEFTVLELAEVFRLTPVTGIGGLFLGLVPSLWCWRSSLKRK